MSAAGWEVWAIPMDLEGRFFGEMNCGKWPGQLGEQGHTSVRGCGRLRWWNTDPFPRRDSGSIPRPGTLPG